MTDQGSGTGDEAGNGAEQRREKGRGNTCLAGVENEGGGSEVLAAGAQHIGGADIARPDGTDIPQPGQARQHETEGNGSDEIAAKNGKGDVDRLHEITP